MYYSRYTKEKHLMLLLMWEQFDNWINDDKTQLNKQEKTWLKTARTYMFKVHESLMQRIDRDYAARLSSLARNVEFLLREKRVLDVVESQNVIQEDLYTLADHALVICQSGKMCKQKNHRECPLYKAMVRMDIPVADIEAKGCPYKLDLKEQKG